MLVKDIYQKDQVKGMPAKGGCISPNLNSLSAWRNMRTATKRHERTEGCITGTFIEVAIPVVISTIVIISTTLGRSRKLGFNGAE